MMKVRPDEMPQAATELRISPTGLADRSRNRGPGQTAEHYEELMLA
jgi:hypothetical protein